MWRILSIRKWPGFYRLLTSQLILVFVCHSTGFSGEESVWNRFRIAPTLSVSEAYTDNVFLTHENTRDDFITRIVPKVRIDFAFTPKNIVSLGYVGSYSFYADNENSERKSHKPYVSCIWTQPKGSKLEVGASRSYSSFLPFSEEDKRKDFDETRAYIDTLAKLGAFTDVAVNFTHDFRRFDRRIDEEDEFDRNSFKLRVSYNRFSFFSPLLEYRYSRQNNNDITGGSTDFDSHSFLLGMKWAPPRRLSGTLKVGYTQADFDEIGDSSGFAIDTNLSYRLSDFTRLNLTTSRRVSRSTRAARESGNYFVSTDVGLSATCRKFDPLEIMLNFFYRNKDFENEDSVDEDREDDLYRFGLQAKYFLQDWLSISMGYQYKHNNSNLLTEDYKENRVTFRLSASI